MRQPLTFLVLMLSFLPAAYSQATKTEPGAPIVLWSGGAPGALGHEPTDTPTLTPYLAPKANATGAAIIGCPGGGYQNLAEHEGRPVAGGLVPPRNTAFLLKHL